MPLFGQLNTLLGELLMVYLLPIIGSWLVVEGSWLMAKMCASYNYFQFVKLSFFVFRFGKGYMGLGLFLYDLAR